MISDDSLTCPLTPRSSPSCDCVGILKERNVDVEQRFKEAASRSGRKKSTKCRLVFRAAVTNARGLQETLQVVSQPIACSESCGRGAVGDWGAIQQYI